MHEPQIIALLGQALVLVLMLSLPPIIVAAVVGILVSFVQALTQIQEQTLSFAFKLVSVTATLLVIAPWLGDQLFEFCRLMFTEFATLTR